MAAAPMKMKMPRSTSAITMPTNSASCWYCRGTANLAMMTMKTNRLSTDNEYSVSQPAKNSVPYWCPASSHTPIPKRIASPTYAESATDTSLVLGSCGCRPMTNTSSSSTETVTMIVVHQTQVGTSTVILPESADRARECDRVLTASGGLSRPR